MEKEKRGGDTVTDKIFVHILDSTLRDGSHALSHQLTAEQVSRIAGGLDDAGVEMVEVSHGDGLGGSTITYGFSKQSELELLKAAVPGVTRVAYLWHAAPNTALSLQEGSVHACTLRLRRTARSI